MGKDISTTAEIIILMTSEEKKAEKEKSMPEENKQKIMRSKEEKEKLIIKLLNENKTYDEIADLANANPTQIYRIKQKLEGVEIQPAMNIRAIKMFKEGMQPIDVTIDLQIGTEETLKYYHEYLLLKGEEEFLKARDKIGKDLLPFVDFFKEMASNFSLKHIKEASRIAWDMDQSLTSLAIAQLDQERISQAVERLIRIRKELQSDNSQEDPAVWYKILDILNSNL